MKRYLLLGLAAVPIFCMALAPASLLTPSFERNVGLQLQAPNGTVWVGAGQLSANALPLGTLHWRFRPLSFLQLAPGYNWRLDNDSGDLSGHANFGLDGAALHVSGTLGVAAVNPWLRRYGMALEGDMTFSDTSVTLASGTVQFASGALSWSGGEVRFELAGLRQRKRLPPLVAQLHDAPTPGARIYPEASDTPVMVVEMLANGYVRIGLTNSLIRLLDIPWRGAGPPDRVVISFEEKLFRVDA